MTDRALKSPASLSLSLSLALVMLCFFARMENKWDQKQTPEAALLNLTECVRGHTTRLKSKLFAEKLKKEH